jgi:mannose/fructose-specific phosphotransferase system component IIA
MSDTALRGVVVGHGDLATGLVSAVVRITGLEEGALIALSNDGLGPDGIREKVDGILQGGAGVVFSDLREGSCGLAGRKACLGRGDRVLVTGVNLPMLLEFVMNRDQSLAELGPRLADRGRRAVECFGVE